MKKNGVQYQHNNVHYKQRGVAVECRSVTPVGSDRPGYGELIERSSNGLYIELDIRYSVGAMLIIRISRRHNEKMDDGCKGQSQSHFLAEVTKVVEIGDSWNTRYGLTLKFIQSEIPPFL